MSPADPRPVPRRGVLAVALPAAVACAALAAIAGGLGSALAWRTGFIAAALATVAGTDLARRHAARDDRARWAWWTAAAAAWLAGEVTFALARLVDVAALSRLGAIGWDAFALLVMGGLLRTRDGTRPARLLAAMEVVPLIAAVLALTAARLWDDVTASSLPLGSRVLDLGYPALYISAAVVTLQAVLGGSLRRVCDGASRFALAGIATQAVAFVAVSEQLLEQRRALGATFVDPLFVIGLLAIAAGGLLAALAGEWPRSERPTRADAGGLLPAITFALLLAALVEVQFVETPFGARLALKIGLAICGALLVARGTVLQRRLGMLLERERAARERLAESQAELAEVNDRLRRDVRRDALTGLYNRRALSDDLPALDAHAARHGESFAIALCDIDHFKAYNDALGHLAGDEALRAVAGIVRQVLRAGDAAYRYGGEELLLVLRSTDAEGAAMTAERVRTAVAGAALPHPAAPSRALSVSVGVAAGTPRGAELIARADAALYEAKRGGRDRVVVAGAPEGALTARSPVGPVNEPILRHLRAMLGVSRAAADGRGVLPVLEAVAATLRSELRFQTVTVNLRDPVDDRLRVVLDVGDADSGAALAGTSIPRETWRPLLDAAVIRGGAYWLPAGSVDWDGSIAFYAPPASGTLDADAWHPHDVLLLPLRGADGTLLGLVSVDEPLSGRRPDDGQIALLMAVVDHGGIALEQAQRLGAAAEQRLAA